MNEISPTDRIMDVVKLQKNSKIFIFVKIEHICLPVNFEMEVLGKDINKYIWQIYYHDLKVRTKYPLKFYFEQLPHSIKIKIWNYYLKELQERLFRNYFNQDRFVKPPITTVIIDSSDWVKGIFNG